MTAANRLRVGLIGSGAIARSHLPGYTADPDRVVLGAIFDVDPQASAAAAAQNGGEPRVFDRVEDLLAARDIDAVDICVPHDQHHAVAMAAAQAGKHILLEKPMGCSLAECHDIVDACERAGVTLMVAQSLRHVPSYRGAKALIDAGGIGRVWSALIEEFLPSDFARQPREPNRRTWYNDGKRAGGGVLITQSTHHIDLLRYFLGDIDRVTCTTWTDNPAYTNGAEDSAIGTMVFKTGAVVQLRASNAVRMQRFHTSILGEDGMIFTYAPEEAAGFGKHHAPAFASTRAQGPYTWNTPAPEPAPLAPPEPLPSDNPFVNEVLHFAECCLEGREPISSGRDNLGTMAALFGLYESARSGGAWVTLPNR
jgi:predicted dehydrogenase